VIERIERALKPFRDSLQADGFELKVEGFENGIISLIILAGPEACHACLVPQEHMQLRLEDRLKGIARVVRLHYPDIPKAPH
jgi:hypothetical protein